VAAQIDGASTEGRPLRRLVANGFPQPVIGSNGLKLKQDEKKISDGMSDMRQIEVADVG
jgi:hypothetical protein